MRSIYMPLVAALVLVGSLTLPMAPMASVAHAQERTEARVSLHIDGMSCASCAAAVRVALRRLDGVREATVSFDEKRARVTYDPRRVTPQRMVETINDLGYRARVEQGS